jgi:NAD(P)-dependent dehydrogenase (short-subunit alcohol dehydrogenase family)
MSAHFAVEEPDITSITVAPGRVNTDMQGVLRSRGKESMAKAVYDNFVEAFENGTLLRPEQPGNVIAAFAAESSKDLSGKSVKYGHSAFGLLSTREPPLTLHRYSWNSPEMAAWQI